jgi:hypothetical protein
MWPKFNKKFEILILYPGYDSMLKKHLTLLSLQMIPEDCLVDGMSDGTREVSGAAADPAVPAF